MNHVLQFDDLDKARFELPDFDILLMDEIADVWHELEICNFLWNL